jgi:transposase-like protein
MSNGFEGTVKEAFWRFHSERQTAGSASIKSYCREHGLAESSFYAWRKKIEKRDAAQDQPSRRLPQGSHTARSSGGNRIRTTQSCATVVPCWVASTATSRCERHCSERVGLVALEIVGDESPQSTVTTTSPTLEIACPGGLVIRLREDVSSNVLQRVIEVCEQSHRVAVGSAAEVREVRLC